MKLTPSVRILVLICLASAGWAFSFGAGSQVISHWLKAHGLTDTVIGLNHSVYYFGVALAAVFVPWLMRSWRRACAPAGLIVSCLSLAMFPFYHSWPGWFGLRLLSGAAAGMSLIPLETLISTQACPDGRTRDFGFYSVALTLGGALGLWAGLHFHQPGETLMFLAGGVPPLLAGLAMLGWSTPPTAGADTPVEPGGLDFHKHFLSYGTAWSQGFLEGGMLAFLSFFLMSLGLSSSDAGKLMGVTMAGVILFQVPVAWLGDRLGKQPMLLACYAGVLAGLAVLPFCVPSIWLAVCLFGFGAFSAALYPLGLSLLADKAAASNLPRVFAWYMAMECFGSQMGAALMGKARDWWGERAMFAVGFAAVAGALLAWIVLRRRPAGSRNLDTDQSQEIAERQAA